MYIHRGGAVCLVALYLSAFSANFLIHQQNVSEPSGQVESGAHERPILDSSHQDKGQLIVRILALFTGSSTDLGLDHRLGRQVLKLAVARARRLNPEVSDVQLLIYNDSSECNSGASGILGQVAQEFYAGQSRDDAEKCDLLPLNGDIREYEPSGRCNISTSLGTSHLTGATDGANSDRIDAILGPSCDHLIDSVARMAAYWRTPIYTVTSISGTFGRKDVYPTLTRLSPSIDHLGLFIMTVMERFKWRHLAIVVDRGQPENMAILANLERTIDRMRYTIPVDRKTFPFSSFAVNGSATQEGDPSPFLHASDEEGGLAAGPLGGHGADLPPPANSQTHCSRESRELLLSVRRVARVVLLLLNDPQVVRRLLVCAHELRFNNGEYTFLALNLGLKSARSTGGGGGGLSSGRRPQRQQLASGKQTFDWFAEDDEANNLRARQMFESLMVFSVELPASNEYNIFVEQTLDLAQQEYPGAHFDHSSVGLLAVALHDSLLLAVEAQRRQFISSRATNNSEPYRTDPARLRNLDDSEYSEDEAESDFEDDEQSGRKVPLLWNERYAHGLISGMHINANGDQELDYVLSDMEPELGVFRPVASYSKEARQIQMLPSGYVHWPARTNAATQQVLHNDEPPPDEPECGFTGEAQHCVDRQNLFTALAILALFSLCLMLIGVVSLRRYRKIKYQMQLDDYWWKISWADLEFLRAQRNSLTSNLASSLVRQLRGSDAAAARSIVGGLGRRSLAGSVVSSAADRRSLASSGHSHTRAKRAALGAFGEPAAADISKRRSAVALVVTPAPSGAGHQEEEEQERGGHGPSDAADGRQQDRKSVVGASRVAKSSAFDDHSTRIIHSEFSTVVRMSSLALYKGEIVIVKQLNGSSIEVSRDLLIELKGMRDLSNENVARLVGLCLDPEHLSIVYEYCSRGNLQDLLLNTSISMDWNLKYSIIGDIFNGLNFLHTTHLDYHGRLKSTNLVLDSRFTVKLTDFGLRSLYNQLELIENNDDDDDDGGEDTRQQLGGQQVCESAGNDAASDTFRRQSMAPTIYNMDSVSMRAENFASPGRGRCSSNLLGGTGGGGGASTAGTDARMRLKNRGSARFFWTAPEHLRHRQPHLAGSKRGDVYSMAIILYEIFTRKQPYYFGTNAKPNWQVIKRDKLRHQGQQARDQQNQHQLMGDTGQHGEHGAGTGASQVMVGRGASLAQKRGSSQASSGAGGGGGGGGGSGTHHKSSSVLSRTRKRRSNASVVPMQQVEGGAAESAETCVARSSSSSLVQRGQEQVAGPEQVKINVSAFAAPCGGDPDTIGEELEGEGESAEVSSTASHQPGQDAAGKRKMSAVSCLSQELKGGGGGGGGARLKSNADSEGAAKLDAEEILDQLRMGIQPEPVRPYIPNYLLQEIDPRMVGLLRSCWHEQPSARPTVNHVRNTMRKITKGATAKNYLDNLLDRLQTYAAQLEMIVDSKSADITAEKERTEELLYQLVPRFVADKLKRSEPIIPQVFDGVTIFFSDIVGFEKYASVMSPCELVDLLNNIYSSFESIISSFDVTKIEVILDQFLVASGISLQQQQEHHENAEQPTEGARDEATSEQAQTGGGGGGSEPKPKSVKSKRRILGALRGGSQSIDSKRASRDQESQDGPGARAAQATNGADPSHYNRSSCEQVARMALCIRDLVKSFHFRQNLNSLQQSSSGQQNDASGAEKPATGGSGGGFVATNFNIRIGIHSGKVCAGIVGVKRPKFCLIGDTVNVASRMHTNSKANRIQISASTRELLKQVPGFAIEPRGRIEIKGKGMMETFWLESSY